jgi:hypothetical protein
MVCLLQQQQQQQQGSSSSLCHRRLLQPVTWLQAGARQLLHVPMASGPV